MLKMRGDIFSCSAFLIFVLSYISGEKLPSDLKICSKTEPKQDKCLTDAAQKYVSFFLKGVPELNIPSLDPWAMDDFQYDQIGIKATLKHLNITGMSKTHINRMTFDWKRNSARLILNVPRMRFVGDYTVKGHLFFLNINGQGVLDAVIKNVDFDLFFQFSLHQKSDGNEYLKLMKPVVGYEVKDDARFKVSNLFNGDQRLGDQILKLVHQNWRFLLKETAQPMFILIGEQIKKTANIYLDQIPLNELFTGGNDDD